MNAVKTQAEPMGQRMWRVEIAHRLYNTARNLGNKQEAGEIPTDDNSCNPAPDGKGM